MSNEEKAGDLSIVSDNGLTEIPEDLTDLMDSLKKKLSIFTKSCEETASRHGVALGITVKFTLDRSNYKRI